MKSIITIIHQAINQFSSANNCEEFVRAHEPNSLYEVEKLIFDYFSEGNHN